VAARSFDKKTGIILMDEIFRDWFPIDYSIDIGAVQAIEQE